MKKAREGVAIRSVAGGVSEGGAEDLSEAQTERHPGC